MVEKFKTILKNLESKKGPIALLALLKMDDILDKWTVVFSASWSTDENRTEVFELIRGEILTKLNPQEISEIARIAIYTKDEHLIEELLKYQSGVELKDQRVNGNVVHCAIIIQSNPAV
jgi:hypothetical protein